MKNEYLQTALDDIYTIKRTLEKSEFNYKAFGVVFTLLSAIFLASSLITRLLNFIIIIFGDSTFLTRIRIIQVISVAISFISLAFSLAIYFKEYKLLKKQKDVYTLPIYKTWGILLFIIPWVSSLFKVVIRFALGERGIYLFLNNTPSEAFDFEYYVLISCAGLFFSLGSNLCGLLFTGVMTKQKNIQVVAICTFALVSVYAMIIGWVGSNSISVFNDCQYYLTYVYNLVILGVGIYYLIKAKKTYG